MDFFSPKNASAAFWRHLIGISNIRYNECLTKFQSNISNTFDAV